VLDRARKLSRVLQKAGHAVNLLRSFDQQIGDGGVQPGTRDDFHGRADQMDGIGQAKLIGREVGDPSRVPVVDHAVRERKLPLPGGIHTREIAPYDLGLVGHSGFQLTIGAVPRHILAERVQRLAFEPIGADRLGRDKQRRHRHQ